MNPFALEALAAFLVLFGLFGIIWPMRIITLQRWLIGKIMGEEVVPSTRTFLMERLLGAVFVLVGLWLFFR